MLLYTSSDRATQTRLARRDAMDLATLRQVYAGIKRHAAGSWAIFDPSRIVLGGEPGDEVDEAPDPRIGIGLLVEGGLLERHPNAPASWTLTPGRNDEAAPGVIDERTSLFGRKLSTGPGSMPRAADRSRCRQPRSAMPWKSHRKRWRGCSKGNRTGRLRKATGCHVSSFSGRGQRRARLQRVLDNAAQRAKTRVNQIMTYAEGRRCRHAELAAHLGERLEPCGVACDVCTQRARGCI